MAIIDREFTYPSPSSESSFRWSQGNTMQASIFRWMPGQPITRDHASTGLSSSDIPLPLPRITIADVPPDVSTCARAQRQIAIGATRPAVQFVAGPPRLDCLAAL